jgi:hypothetical protein
MSEAQGQEKKDEKGVVGYSKAFTELEELSVLIDYLIARHGSAFQAFASLPAELYYEAKKIYDEERTYDWRDLLIEISRVQTLNDLLYEIVKAGEDYGFFIWRDNVKEYLKIIAKLASIWKVFDTTESPQKNVKPEELQEQLKAVEEELKKTVFDIIHHAYHCDEPEDEEGCCDDEPEEPDDEPDYDEEEGDEA